MAKSILFFHLFLFHFYCQAQNQNMEDRNVVFYFKEVAQIELQERIKQNLLIDSVTIAKEYLDTITNKINEKGFHKNVAIKEQVYNQYFTNYLYLKQINHKNKRYALYFTLTGFYEIEFVVFEFSQKEKHPLERIKRDEITDLQKVMKVRWMYQEAPKKNVHDANIFIQNDYLVFESGQIYLSAVHLKTMKPLHENENPFRISNFYGKEDNIAWVKNELHQQIKTLID